MKIEKQIINLKYYTEKRKKTDIKYIVVKDIDNKASPHYIIRNGIAIQLIPDDRITDAVNGGRLNKYGYLHGICTKYNSISIGIIDNLSEEDTQTCINLIMTIKQRYKIKSDNIIRQLDITGESSPYIWRDTSKWNTDIKDNLIEL